MGAVLRGVLALLWVVIVPPLAWSASFHECASVCVPFHVSPLPFPISPLISPHVCSMPHGCCSFLNMSELVHGDTSWAEVLVVNGLLTPVSDWAGTLWDQDREFPDLLHTGHPWSTLLPKLLPFMPKPRICHSLFPPLLFYFSDPVGNRTLLTERTEIFVKLSQDVIRKGKEGRVKEYSSNYKDNQEKKICPIRHNRLIDRQSGNLCFKTTTKKATNQGRCGKRNNMINWKIKRKQSQIIHSYRTTAHVKQRWVTVVKGTCWQIYVYNHFLSFALGLLSYKINKQRTNKNLLFKLHKKVSRAQG